MNFTKSITKRKEMGSDRDPTMIGGPENSASTIFNTPRSEEFINCKEENHRGRKRNHQNRRCKMRLGLWSHWTVAYAACVMTKPPKIPIVNPIPIAMRFSKRSSIGLLRFFFWFGEGERDRVTRKYGCRRDFYPDRPFQDHGFPCSGWAWAFYH